MNRISSSRDINWSDVIRQTADFMIKNNLNDLVIGEKISNKNGVWGRLSEIVFKKSFCQANALYLSKNWERDRNCYRNSVLNILKNKDKIRNGSLNCIQFNFTEFEWTEVQKFVSQDSKERKYFKSEFDVVLSKKLQQNGVKCWVYCNFNYFLRKTNLVWKGEFICRECKIKFFPIMSRSDVCKNLIVTWYREIEHETAVIPPKRRITGEERKQFGYQLKSKGVTNYIAESSNFEECNDFLNFFN